MTHIFEKKETVFRFAETQCTPHYYHLGKVEYNTSKGIVILSNPACSHETIHCVAQTIFDGVQRGLTLATFALIAVQKLRNLGAQSATILYNSEKNMAACIDIGNCVSQYKLYEAADSVVASEWLKIVSTRYCFSEYAPKVHLQVQLDDFCPHVYPIEL